MCSFEVCLFTVLSLIISTSSIEVERIIGDANLFNTQGIEEKNPSGFRLTKLLDIRLNGKSEILEANLDKLIGSDKVNNIDEKYSKIDGNTSSDVHIEQFRKEMNKKMAEIVAADRDINSEVVKIRQYNYNTENDVEKEIVGFKTTVGVQYKRSAIINGKNSFNKKYPKSCKEILDSGNNVSGIYEIHPKISTTPIVVLCDMETRGGGWTHIQKRYDGSQDFYLGWRDYKFGFGDLDAEFWIGLENIYKMTAQDGSELLVELEDRDGSRAYALYTSFKIGMEKEGYPLNVLSGYSGDAGDPLMQNKGNKFSTNDLDQDEANVNCAEYYRGAWWYKDNGVANLNGQYINLDLSVDYNLQGMRWEGLKPHYYCYAKSRMLIRTT